MASPEEKEVLKVEKSGNIKLKIALGILIIMVILLLLGGGDIIINIDFWGAVLLASIILVIVAYFMWRRPKPPLDIYDRHDLIRERMYDKTGKRLDITEDNMDSTELYPGRALSYDRRNMKTLDTDSEGRILGSERKSLDDKIRETETTGILKKAVERGAKLTDEELTIENIKRALEK